MTFLAYLAAQADPSCQRLQESLSGLPEGANDLAEVIAHIRATLGDSEAVLAVEEAVWRWEMWRESLGIVERSRTF
jgi:protein subunit release factor A